jgi:hypothetical protein
MSYLSRVVYTGDDSTVTWTVPFPYLDDDHVKVYLDGVLTTSYAWDNPNTIRFNSAPEKDAIIIIKRETPKDERLVTFQDNSIADSENFNLDSDQEHYISQEVVDNDSVSLNLNNTLQYWDAQTKKIKNLDHPSDPTDAATKHYVDKGSTEVAITQAQIATTQAGIATTQAGIATTQAETATEQAGIATTQAGIAEDIATEIENQAANICHTVGSGLANETYTKTEADSLFLPIEDADFLPLSGGILTGNLGFNDTNSVIEETSDGRIQIKSVDNRAMIVGKTTVNFGFNCYWDGSNWFRFDEAAIAYLVNLGSPGLRISKASAGSGAISSWDLYTNQEVFHEGNCPSSLTTSGYQQLANGWILQWGTTSLVSGVKTVTLPIAFPNACRSAVASATAASETSVAVGISSRTKTSIGLGWNSSSNDANWIAIGY